MLQQSEIFINLFEIVAELKKMQARNRDNVARNLFTLKETSLLKPKL